MSTIHFEFVQAVLTGRILLFWRDGLTTPATPQPDPVMAMLARTDDNLPIVIAEGLRFFEIEEAAPTPIRDRLIYVTLPEGAASPDPSNENQVKRWIDVRTDLRIEAPSHFLATHPRFHVLYTVGYSESLVDWLRQRGLLGKVRDWNGREWLFDCEQVD